MKGKLFSVLFVSVICFGYSIYDYSTLSYIDSTRLVIDSILFVISIFGFCGFAFKMVELNNKRNGKN